MLKILRIFILISLFSQVLPVTQLSGQEKEGTVKYTPDFRFTDGIYLNFDQVKLNSPIPKSKLLTSVDYNDREFFKKILEGDKIFFYDNMGVRQEVVITFVGNICHFVADITTIDRSYNSPYGYYDPYYYPYSYSNYYSPYYSPYRSNMTRNELKQYLIDFESGKVLEFDVDNTELLLMKDDKLYEEYVQLSRKKKKDLMFVYIRKFNENNPLYIPVPAQ
jgi:hypothetical protein